MYGEKAHQEYNIRIAPHHSASNDLEEKNSMNCLRGTLKKARGTLNNKLDRFFFQYCVTPHSTTGKLPAELPMGRKLHTH